MGLDDPVWAYQFDMAVSWAGHFVEAKLFETDDKGRPRHRLADLLDARAEGRREKKAYTDPLTGKVIWR